MPVIFKDLTVDQANNLGDKVVKESSGGGGNNKNDIGGKTFKEIRKEEVSNSQNKRRKESEGKVVKSLEHFPKEDNRENMDRNIERYCDWLTKSLKIGEPVIETKDLDYSQFSAGGPGGQNVNKVSNGVLYKHLITGLFANSRDSRNTIENRNHAAELLYKDLEELVNEWRNILSDISPRNWEDAVKIFIKKSVEI